MRRILALLCTIALMLAAGCNGEAERDTDKTSEAAGEARAEGAEAEEEMGAAEEEMGEEEMAEGAEEMAQGEEDMAQGAEEMAQAGMVSVATKAPYGDYLADAKGMSLYMFEADTKGKKSACNDDCAAAWPPLTVEDESMVSAGEGVDANMLGTIERDDGTMQVTYAGWPLYYFAKDTTAGDTKGQDVEGFGAEWYLMSPSGEKIEEEGQALR